MEKLKPRKGMKNIPIRSSLRKWIDARAVRKQGNDRYIKTYALGMYDTMAHKNKSRLVRIPVRTLNKLAKLKLFRGEPWYSVIDRLIKRGESK